MAVRPLLTDYTRPVAIPAGINHGLSAASEATMIRLLGVPGKLTRDCSTPSGRVLARTLWNVPVGPFRVTGLDVAVGLLKTIFAEAKAANPALVAACRSDGMLCCRSRRPDPTQFSNHSWGSAIDLYFGSAAMPQGQPKAQQGVAMLAPFFMKHGFYWGAGFSGGSTDSMHMELAEETIRRLFEPAA